MATLQTNIKSASLQALPSTTNNLPAGSCNYKDIARGIRTPTCGCKRFWLNVTTSAVDGASQDNAWCFCGHHACFHDPGTQQAHLSTSNTIIPPVRTTTPQPKPIEAPQGYISVSSVPAGLGIRPNSRAQSQSINTRVWNALNGFARAQEHMTHSATTSQLPSTTHSFEGDAQTQKVMAPPQSVPFTVVTRPGEYEGSATEVATPSIAGTPDLDMFVPPGAHARLSPSPAPIVPGSASQDKIQGGSAHINHTQDIMEMLRAHNGRLDALECLSFSYVPVEEVQDKFETVDGRLLGLEQWRSEIEDRLHAEDARVEEKSLLSRKRRLLPAETSSFASDESFDVTAAAHAEAAVLATLATNVEVGPRIDRLEGRIAALERTALPSYSEPWEVQVVLLPWGRNLGGVWFPSVDAAQQSLRTQPEQEEWTGAQSLAKTSFRSASSDAWTTESIQAWAENAQDWLSPKACGPSGTVFQRLASRGLVRDVTFEAPDARHVLDVLATTFKHVLPDLQKAEPEDSEKYHGLRATFLPLRKIRKSTRLRFLSHAEMVTQAVWTASFLESSIFMKLGDRHRRLYITTPQAYLQNAVTGLTWQQLRQLPARDFNGEVQAGQIDSSVAIEACWSYNDKIDHIPSLHSSFVSQAVWSTKSQKSSSDEEHVGQLTPALSGFSGALHQRTMSLPSSIAQPEQMRDVLSKRRIASFETAGAASLSINTSLETTKRRRISKSPEIERRGVYFTPRWSREPPSPFTSENAVEAAASRKRGTTPFAYATPHSNAHITTMIDYPFEGDTERDSEGYQSGVEDEEEWHGMDAIEPGSGLSGSGNDDDNEIMDEEDNLL